MNAPHFPSSLPLVLPGVCRRWRCEAGWKWSRPVSEVPPEQELWLVWAGRGRMRAADGERSMRPGFCAWMRPGSSYAAAQEGDDLLGITSIRFRFQNRAVDLAAAYPEFYDAWDLAYVDAVTRRIVEIVGAGDAYPCPEVQETAGLLLAGLLSDLPSRFAPGAGRVPSATERQHREAVQRVVRRIEEGFSRPLSVAALAREAGYSPTHFSVLFKKIAGETAEAMIVRMRIDRAGRLLCHTGLSIGEIADRTGYRDVYFFSRQFKSKTSLTPTAYRLSRGDRTSSVPVLAGQ